MSYKSKTHSFFSNQSNIVMVYLFGSQMWKVKPEDIDIAVLFENGKVPDTYQLINL